MYNYEEEREKLFTDKGQRLFIAIRDQVKRMLKISGAVTMSKAIELPEGIGCASNWESMACVDRMVELEELKEIPTTGFYQHRIFISSKEC